jgi:hypothetical protein
MCTRDVFGYYCGLPSDLRELYYSSTAYFCAFAVHVFQLHQVWDFWVTELYSSSLGWWSAI